ncbi:MAG: hypothetical protein GX046_09115 [Tissierellia bacterium]|jgi:apolipoprotein D and lipocalin family protein|nr:hypothetical protein [Tissierellia bacterium]
MEKDLRIYNGIELICDLDLNKYLGKWYEIGKLSAKEQGGLDNVTALYTLRSDKKIGVDNRGYKNGKKRGIKGLAWLRDEKCSGGLYVQFFWPFKADYNVIKLASDYRYALVMGKSKSSLWILSRTPKMNKKDYLEIIKFLDSQGFETSKILKTRHS